MDTNTYTSIYMYAYISIITHTVGASRKVHISMQLP